MGVKRESKSASEDPLAWLLQEDVGLYSYFFLEGGGGGARLGGGGGVRGST
jgi:hypothetical protein